MDLCDYNKLTKCTKCDYPFRLQCKKFRVAHLAFLTRNIRPFKYNDTLSVTSKVVWSKSIHAAKTAAVKFAMKTSSEIKVLTLSQSMSLKLNNQDVEGKVIFIDCSNKPAGDLDKVKSVFTSFVDDLSLKGCFVSIFVNSSLNLNLEYTKLC